jgi:hypothetical protein
MGGAFQGFFSLYSMSHFDWPITRNKTKKKKTLKRLPKIEVFIKKKSACPLAHIDR